MSADPVRVATVGEVEIWAVAGRYMVTRRSTPSPGHRRPPVESLSLSAGEAHALAQLLARLPAGGG